MWIEEIDIQGFRRLAGKFEFGPGLNLVHGLNEAGKSSLHDALVRAVCGFSRSERTKPRDGGPSLHESCAPWNGNPYKLSATINTDKGRVRVEWDFAGHEVKVLDLNSGEDLSEEVRAKRKEVKLAQYLLGLSREDFVSACCLRQAEISPVAHSEPLVVALQKAVESGATDTGVDEAEAKLNEFLGSRIGVRRDNLNPLAAGRLAKLIARGEELRASLETTLSAREQLTELVLERQDAQRELYELQQRAESAERAVFKQNADSLADRLSRASAHKAGASPLAPDVKLPTADDEAAIAGLFAQVDDLSGDLAGIEPSVSAAKDRISELERERQAVQAQVDGLSAYDGVSTDSADQIRELVARLAESRKTLSEARARQAAAEEAAGADGGGTPTGAGDPRPMWIAAAVVAAASIAAGVLASPLALAGLALAGVLALLAGRRSGALSASPTTDDDHGHEPSVEGLEERVGQLQSELADALDDAGAAAHEQPDRVEERAQAYLTASEGAGRLADARARLNKLAAEVSTAREPVVQQEAIQRRLETSRQDLASRLRDLSIDATDEARARVDWDMRQAAARDYREKAAAAEEAGEGLKTALGGMSYEELESASEQAAQELQAHIKRYGDLDAVPPNGLSAAAWRDQVQAEHQKKELELIALATQAEEREADLPSVPALREALEANEAEVARLESAAQTITIARDALVEAGRRARRDFQPRLRDSLNRNIAQITGGRYEQVEVDDQLNIKVIAPESGELTSVDQLSQGTQDQIFCLERLEIANLLDPATGTAPLLLDEPFVHFDHKRLPSALELVAEEAADRQVMVFTTDSSMADDGRKLGKGVTVIDLGGP